jgi:hypothetical protein
MASFYQDRLGTNIGKTQKKTGVSLMFCGKVGGTLATEPEITELFGSAAGDVVLYMTVRNDQVRKRSFFAIYI